MTGRSGHFPSRCNLLRFWEAELRGGWGAGGDGEGRGCIGGACRGGWVSLTGPDVGGGIDPSPILAAQPA
jgi:hypothetical protein